MRCFALITSLAALAAASALPQQSCGPVNPSLGAPCLAEGLILCDATCSSILICHDGVILLKNVCAPGTCTWDDEVESPYCLARVEEPHEETGQDDAAPPTVSLACGFTQKAGDKCSVLIKEGDMLCDRSCDNILRCHNSTMVVNTDCGKNGTKCYSDGSQRLGEGVWCRKNKYSLPVVIEDGLGVKASTVESSAPTEIPRIEGRGCSLPPSYGPDPAQYCLSLHPQDGDVSCGPGRYSGSVCQDGQWVGAYCGPYEHAHAKCFCKRLGYAMCGVIGDDGKYLYDEPMRPSKPGTL